jgi:transglutaminase-like putative cysteine protease
MRGCTGISLATGLLAALPLLSAEPAEETPRKRTFHFTYAGTVTGLKAGENARVWLAVPPTNEDQDVTAESRDLPGPAKEGRDPQYGNRIVFFEAAADADGNVPFSLIYRVMRREVKGAERDRDDDLVKRFLEPDRLVPIDGKPLSLLKDRNLPHDATGAARVMYDVVNGHMKYDKSGTGWGRGDAVWACDSQHGNCTDFHSLFISLARANKIPAKFEIGFGLPEKRGSGDVAGYHCWAKFRTETGAWVPVDISEANKDPKMKEYYFGNLTENRVVFSTGRDITLEPKQQGEPLNFFVYPYVEVGGKPYPAEKIKKTFSYRDVDSPAGGT